MGLVIKHGMLFRTSPFGEIILLCLFLQLHSVDGDVPGLPARFLNTGSIYCQCPFPIYIPINPHKLVSVHFRDIPIVVGQSYDFPWVVATKTTTSSGINWDRRKVTVKPSPKTEWSSNSMWIFNLLGGLGSWCLFFNDCGWFPSGGLDLAIFGIRVGMSPSQLMNSSFSEGWLKTTNQ